jgi:hypothetical protein
VYPKEKKADQPDTFVPSTSWRNGI